MNINIYIYIHKMCINNFFILIFFFNKLLYKEKKKKEKKKSIYNAVEKLIITN